MKQAAGAPNPVQPMEQPLGGRGLPALLIGLLQQELLGLQAPALEQPLGPRGLPARLIGWQFSP